MSFDEKFHEPYQQPVNFNDEGAREPLGHDARSVDHATTLSYPQTYHSGVTAQYEDPYDNDNGQTRAQRIISEYRDGPRSRPTSESEPLAAAEDSPTARQRKQSAGGASSLLPFNDGASQAVTYFDENFNYYSTRNLKKRGDEEADETQAFEVEPSHRGLTALDYADAPEVPPVKRGPLAPLADRLGFGNLKYPIEQRIENRRMGVYRQRWPILVPILTIAMVSVVIYELVLNAHAQGTPISFHPTVNYMLGPSGSALINVGARFVPCMKLVAGVPITTEFACLNDTANPATIVCPLSDICGFGGFPDGVPNQWFRFILPIFLHVGIIHILLNMIAQNTLCWMVERQVGTTAFAIIYFAAGIFGNVLGANFALLGITSMGASGAIFGTVATQWVDLLAHWGLEVRPVRSLIFLIIEVIVGIGLGYIPGVDNFAHIGGFLMGLLTSVVLFPVISVTRRHMLIMWGFRLAAIPIIIVLFVVLIRNFYTGDPYAACSWCRYLSCIPTSANDYCQGTGLTGTTAF